MARPVRIIVCLLVSVALLFELPYAVVRPYSTRESAGSSVSQVMVAALVVLSVEATFVIFGGSMSGAGAPTVKVKSLTVWLPATSFERIRP